MSVVESSSNAKKIAWITPYIFDTPTTFFLSPGFLYMSDPVCSNFNLIGKLNIKQMEKKENKVKQR